MSDLTSFGARAICTSKPSEPIFQYYFLMQSFMTCDKALDDVDALYKRTGSLLPTSRH
jgi:hypothetical protein